MAAPPKPWERQPGVNRRQATIDPDGINTFRSGSPYMAPGMGSGGGMAASASSAPPIPPRPQYPSSVSRPGYGNYGSFGGYGAAPYYGGAVGGYGAYGNTFGGLNQYGMIPGRLSPDDSGFIRVAEESSRQAFQNIASIVEAFNSVSMMLSSTYQAMFSSFRAVLGVAENFSQMKSQFAQIFSALAVVRTLRWLYRKLLYLMGLRPQDPSLEAVWQAAGNFSGPRPGELREADLKPSKSWPLFMFLAIVFGGPYLIWRLLSSMAINVKPRSNAWISGKGVEYFAIAQYDFKTGNKKDLAFSADQRLFLAPRDQQPNMRGWLLASDGQNMGFIPANHVKIYEYKNRFSLGPPRAPHSNQQVAPRIPNIQQNKGTAYTPGRRGTYPQIYRQPTPPPTNQQVYRQQSVPANQQTYRQPTPPSNQQAYRQLSQPANQQTYVQRTPPSNQQAYRQPSPPANQQTYGQPTSPTSPSNQQAYRQPSPPANQQTYGQSTSPSNQQAYRQPSPPTNQQTYGQPLPPTNQQTYRQLTPPFDPQTYRTQPPVTHPQNFRPQTPGSASQTFREQEVQELVDYVRQTTALNGKQTPPNMMSNETQLLNGTEDELRQCMRLVDEHSPNDNQSGTEEDSSDEEEEEENNNGD